MRQPSELHTRGSHYWSVMHLVDTSLPVLISMSWEDAQAWHGATLLFCSGPTNRAQASSLLPWLLLPPCPLSLSYSPAVLPTCLPSPGWTSPSCSTFLTGDRVSALTASSPSTTTLRQRTRRSCTPRCGGGSQRLGTSLSARPSLAPPSPPSACSLTPSPLILPSRTGAG